MLFLIVHILGLIFQVMKPAGVASNQSFLPQWGYLIMLFFG
jgi:hypothetical protein